MGGAEEHIHAKIYIVCIACHIYCIFKQHQILLANCDKIRQKTQTDSLGNLCIFLSGLSFAIYSLKNTLFQVVFLLQWISDSATGLSAIFFTSVEAVRQALFMVCIYSC